MVGNHPQIAELFRFLNYYNLPRVIPQKWMVYKGQSDLEMDDLGVPPFSGNLHVSDKHNTSEGY